eukprot:6472786-Prymnesium_polylepis.1
MASFQSKTHTQLGQCGRVVRWLGQCGRVVRWLGQCGRVVAWLGNVVGSRPGPGNVVGLRPGPGKCERRPRTVRAARNDDDPMSADVSLIALRVRRLSDSFDAHWTPQERAPHV